MIILAEKKKRNFSQNINKIVESRLQQNPDTYIDFALQENKRSGSKYLSMRQFTKTDTYEGPTKNGFSLYVETIEEIEVFQKAFNDFFEKAKQYVE